MENLQKRRFKHLQFYIKQNFNNIQYDPIICQMGKHQISSTFAIERMTEFLTQIISLEREKYIQEITNGIIAANQSKKHAWRILKNEINSHDHNMLQISQRNSQLRQQIFSLENAIYQKEWHLSCEKDSQMQKIQKVKSRLINTKPSLENIRKFANQIKDDLEIIKQSFASMKQSLNSEVNNAKSNSRAKFSNYENSILNQILNEKRQKEKRINKINEEMRCSIKAVVTHINECYQVEPLQLVLENIDVEFDTILESIINCQYKGIINGFDIKRKIESKEKEYDYRMNKLIHSQKIKLGLLQSTLHDLEMKLDQIQDDNLGVDPKSMEELTSQHFSCTTIIENKTDQLINQTMKQ